MNYVKTPKQRTDLSNLYSSNRSNQVDGSFLHFEYSDSAQHHKTSQHYNSQVPTQLDDQMKTSDSDHVTDVSQEELDEYELEQYGFSPTSPYVNYEYSSQEADGYVSPSSLHDTDHQAACMTLTVTNPNNHTQMLVKTDQKTRSLDAGTTLPTGICLVY
jgi:hypothetical protein